MKHIKRHRPWCRRAVWCSAVVWTWLVLGSPFWFGPVVYAEYGQTRHVLVLYSGPLDFPATRQAEKGIREVFVSRTRFNIQLFSEYLDLSRFRDEGQRTAQVDLLRQRYAQDGIDLIISVDLPAAEFLLQFADQVFGETPIVMCSIPRSQSDRFTADALKSRAVVVFEPSIAEELVATALTLRPASRHAVLIAGDYDNDRIRVAQLRKVLSLRGKQLELIDLSGLAVEHLVERLRRLPTDAVIFFSTFFVDATGRSFVPRDVLRLVADNADIPVFGPYESYMGAGIVGGRLISLMRQGQRAAELGSRILNGADPTDISFDDGRDTCVTTFDWRQLQRWQIDHRNLPAEANLLYREPTLWDLYKYYFLGTFLLVALQSVLIVALMVNLRQRKKAEMALRDSQQDLEVLAGRLISSQEEELRRLSREFHDDIAQRLAAVSIAAGTLEKQSGKLAPQVSQKIEHIKDELICLSEDVHSISRELHPAILKDLGLERAVRSLCMTVSDRENLNIEFHPHAVPETVPKEAALCVYRIVQESLRNIAKHARAHNVEVSLRHCDAALCLEVTDDGVGFAPKSVRHTPGIGLASMRERVQFAKGEFTIRSEPGKGTSVAVAVPIEGSAS